MKEEFKINLSLDERIRCLKEINNRLKRVLYVYEKTQEPGSNYNYKVFCTNLIMFVSSSNDLFEGELINVIVNLNSILTNDLEKGDIKKLVFESVNYVSYMLGNYKKLKEKERSSI